MFVIVFLVSFIVFIVTIIISVMVQVTELLLLKRFVSYSIRAYVGQVISLCLLVMIISSVIPYIFTLMMTSGFYRLLVVSFSSVVTITISVYYVGIDKDTRSFINEKIKNIIIGKLR